MFPNRVPMERDTPSPEPLVYLFMYVSQRPQNGAVLQKYSHLPGAPRRRKAYKQWGAAWFPKGIVNDISISNPVPCSPRDDAFYLGLGRPDRR